MMFVLSAARRRRLITRTPIAVVLACAVGVLFAVPASAKSPAEIAAETAPKVVGTPCTATAKACVDVNGKKAWLIKDGKIFRGPVRVSTGKPGNDTQTGNVFRVYRKEKDYKSNEFRLPNGQPSPMPNAVFFHDGGIAFHAGNPAIRSNGCVRMAYADSVAFFSHLQLGDQVQVMNGPVAAKPLTDAQIAAAHTSPSDYADQEDDGGHGDSDKKKSDSDKKKEKKKDKDADD